MSLSPGSVLRVVLIVVLAYLVLGPLVRLQALAFADGGRAYVDAASLRNIGETIGTTIALAGISLVIAMVLGTSLAWAATMLPPRAGWLAVLPILPLVMPPVASVIGWMFLLAPRAGYLNTLLRSWGFDSGGPGLPSGPIDVYTPMWIIIITGLGLTSFVYVFVRSGLARMNYELVQAARSSGSSATSAFFRIVLPVIRPSLVYGGSVALLLGLGQFTAPLLLGLNNDVRVITTEVYRFAQTPPVDYGLAAALASPLLLAGLILVVVQRGLLGNRDRFVADAGKGSRPEDRSSKLAMVYVLIFALVALILPAAALLVVALSPFWGSTLDVSTFSFDNFAALFSTRFVVDALTTSLVTSSVAVLIALPIGYLVADIVVRRKGNPAARGLLDVLASLPLGVPAVVFGAGFLYVYSRPPLVLYGTPWAIVLVYVVIMLPFTVRLQLAARISLGDHYEAAARVSGASSIRAHLTVILPMIRGALSGAAALMFVMLTHEFAASLLVRSKRTQVLGTALYDYWLSGSYPMVAAMALLMCAVTTVGVIIAVVLGGSTKTLDRL